ncbi:solute carrier family 25 member 35 [Leptinotarsa decemlineata]|uniref:solute carrier family 25 member 35 n=1 Tax=Leptinotarsa decemlineata TaxID=7539 RepID=UPI000C254DD5|nr:solute carrier family 25 member 35-like [Leptinotarsa decemlineata]XP_023024934.1 solute carrier family 25 member 35-like [Leptinotarsa decemlineata]XP_023024935.1 solute carrier family 25 member 35-like [Leptinotarsa decemlineata]XP_023024936.1 solute carrier family 25 member 35-like [Leptinotarsa decemlineata]
MDFVIGGLAACGASIFSNPFDVVKTRMQLQGELRAKGQHDIFYKNVFHASWVIGKNEGIRGLQKGLLPAMAMHSIRNSIRLGSYQWFNKKGYLTNEKGKTIFYRSAIASAFCGAAGAFMGSPLFLVKTQLQSQAADNISVGTQHGHKGVFAAFKTIYSKEGIAGLWRGANATMLRAVAGSSAQLTSFAISKDMLTEYDLFKRIPLLSSLIGSIISGVFQCLIMNPFDLVSVRLYNQGVDKSGKGILYKNIPDAFIKIAKTEGLTGFYKGVGANYMRLAPHGALCLVFWDILRDLQAKYLE